jgi:hypothetical protein
METWSSIDLAFDEDSLSRHCERSEASSFALRATADKSSLCSSQ